LERNHLISYKIEEKELDFIIIIIIKENIIYRKRQLVTLGLEWKKREKMRGEEE